MRQLALTLLAAISLVGCSNPPPMVVEDFASITADPPPEDMLGLRQGQIGAGLLTLRVEPGGHIASCLEDRSYRYAGTAKYTRGAIHFDDGSQAKMRLSRSGELQIIAPSANAATVLHQVTNTKGSSCQ